MEHCRPDQVIKGLGGQGLAALFGAESEGPRIMVRCELDALPIPESLDIPHRSQTTSVSHKCGHDGHMAILAGLAASFGRKRPSRGSVVLLFQPSEETGEGAERVLRDPKFDSIEPDYVLALHNLPGFPLEQVIIKSGVFAAASSGLHIHLEGQTSHAAQPEAGKSPALAIGQLIQQLSAIPQFYTALHEPAQVTVVHARVGEIAFGTSPGVGDIMVTLRAHSQHVIDLLTERAVRIGECAASTFGLEMTSKSTELFPPTVNDHDVVTVVEDCARKEGLSTYRPEQPFAWSEDFGHFTSKYRGVLFGFGAGENHPALHHPDYDFPDDLIQPGIRLLESTTRKLLELKHV